MGDSGSMFLGFMLACIAIKLRFAGQVPEVSWLVPLIVLALPLFDTTLVSHLAAAAREKPADDAWEGPRLASHLESWVYQA